MKKSGKDALSIGIDLGTTCTCVGVWRQGRVKIIINKHCRITTPSCVGFGRSSIFVGDDAINTSMVDGTNLIFDAKRLLGKKFSDFQVQEDMKLWPFKVTQGDNDTPKIQVTYKDNKEHFAAEDISCIILGKMKELAESYMGETVGKAVITVPAYFNNAQREATKKAGTKAGLNVIRLINEPTAAAIAYVKQNKLVITENMNLLVFDLGGGTFDVSIATITEGGENIEVKAIAGDPHLGGLDFDNKMVEHCFEEFMRKHGRDLNVDMNVFGKLRCACELGKIHLSSEKLTDIYVDHFFEGKKFEMEFSRATFENLTSGLRERCIEKVMGCLNDANMSASCINRVLLVGGSTKIPSIQSALKNVFGENKLFMDVDVQEAVAIGATMMAAKLSPKDKAFQDFTLRDVTPLLLGIGVEGDVFDVVIPQNTSIPVKRSKKYTPTEDEQTSIDTIVNERERTHASNNHRLGTCTMTGMSPAPKKARLSTNVIDKMKALADKFKVPDGCFKKASVELHSLIATMNDTTKSMPKGEQLNKIEDALSDTTKWLKEKKGASGDELQAKKKSLETIFMQNKVDGTSLPF